MRISARNAPADEPDYLRERERVKGDCQSAPCPHAVDHPLEGEPVGGRQLAAPPSARGRPGWPGSRPGRACPPPPPPGSRRAPGPSGAGRRWPGTRARAGRPRRSHRQPLEAPHRGLPRARVAAERREVVLADQLTGRRPHRREVHPPAVGATRTAASNGSGTGAVVDAVAVLARARPRTARRSRRAPGGRRGRRPRARARPLIASPIRPGLAVDAVGNETTCPRACTPASVRPATASSTRSPGHRTSAVRQHALDGPDRRVRCAAHPRNPVPS